MALSSRDAVQPRKRTFGPEEHTPKVLGCSGSRYTGIRTLHPGAPSRLYRAIYARDATTASLAGRLRRWLKIVGVSGVGTRAGDGVTPVAPAVALEHEERTLRGVVEDNADLCFLDTDGVTRDATRMLQIMNGWQPRRSDLAAGVRRNSAFDPDLPVIIAGTHVRYSPECEHPGQKDILYTLVPRDAVV